MKALARAPRPVGHLYTIAVFVFGWSFFWITDPSQLVPYWEAMLGVFGATGTSTMWELAAWEYWPVLVVCVLASTPVAPFLKERLAAWAEGRPARSVTASGGTAHPRTMEAGSLMDMDISPASPSRGRAYSAACVVLDAFLLALLLASCASIVSGSFNPFIYFQF